MIKCNRCGCEGPLVVLESNDYLDGADTDWALCSDCYVKFRNLMVRFLSQESILVEAALGPHRP